MPAKACIQQYLKRQSISIGDAIVNTATESYVCPISVHRFFSGPGHVLQSELLWIWLPAILFAGVVFMLRRSERVEVATD
jgi:hypothetical protein